MSIPIVKEPPDMGPPERCCFCRTPTRMWTDLPSRKPGEQVACCEKCAAKEMHRDVPTKKEWLAVERGQGWAIP